MSRFGVLMRGLVVASGFAIALSNAMAQSQPIKMLVGFPPGGTMTPQATEGFVQAEVNRWQAVIQRASHRT